MVQTDRQGESHVNRNTVQAENIGPPNQIPPIF